MKFRYQIFAFSFILISLLLPLTIIFPCEPYDPIFMKLEDKSKSDVSFMEFKSRLQKAIKEKDVKFINSITSNDISFAFEEGGFGKKAFLKSWNLDKNPKTSNFWETLSQTINLGFNFKDELWTAPYLFNSYPESVDPYSQSLIIGNTVNIRDKPSAKGKILTQLSWEFVKNEYEENPATQNKMPGEPCRWQKVCLSDGQTGYICEQFLRSPFEYRVGFQKTNNKYMMIFFTTGSD